MTRSHKPTALSTYASLTPPKLRWVEPALGISQAKTATYDGCSSLRQTLAKFAIMSTYSSVLS